MSPGGALLPAGELLWTPPEDVRSGTRLGRYMTWLEDERGKSFAGYEQLWDWSVEELEEFWGSIWDYFEVLAHEQPTSVLGSERMPGASWFPGATLNYAEHALRAIEPERAAIIARSQTRPDRSLDGRELAAQVGAVQAGLKRLGVGCGDRVAGYMPNIPETVIAFLACAGLGATWAVCPPEFGAQAALNRLGRFAPTVLLAVDGYRWGEKVLDRREAVQEIRRGLPALRSTVHVPYLDVDGEPAAGAISWDQLSAEPGELVFEAVPFDHPLWVLFSSGTTGPPKAFIHGHGGAVVEQLKSLALHHDLGRGDRMFFFSTTGWMVWNQVVSALLTGAGIVLLDGDPMYPRSDALWELAADTDLTHFGASASYYLLCRRDGLDPQASHSLERIRFLKSAGSPLPAELYRWIAERFPGVFLSSSSGGTEVCSGFVGGVTILPVTAGEMAGRWLGVAAEAWDEQGDAVIDEPGELVIRRPMPSMPTSLLGDSHFERYRAEYFERYPGAWAHRDWFVVSERGSCAILGRSDATLNRGGVRLGTGEFYDVLDRLPEISESLVVHIEGEDGGLGELILFVSLEQAAGLEDGLSERIAATLRAELSPRHVPDQLVVLETVPRGRTGKRLEVPVKRILLGADPGSVLAPGDIDEQTLQTLTAMARDRDRGADGKA
jgi:acetoacetyl-CoA synthetase